MTEKLAGHRLILIPGQKKSGTTTLYEALAASFPNTVDVPKESSILTLSPRRLARRLSQEKGPATLIDATTTYFRNGAFPETMLRNMSAFDQVQVLLMLRPEAERLPSHYRHACNFDGWTGDFERFLVSPDYLDHADLTGMHGALRDAGIDDIRIVPFAHLDDAQNLRALIHDLFGISGVVRKAAANEFGSRKVISGSIEAMIARPEFQVLLRPLLPASLRQWSKRMLFRDPDWIPIPDLETERVRDMLARIERTNAALAKTADDLLS